MKRNFRRQKSFWLAALVAGALVCAAGPEISFTFQKNPNAAPNSQTAEPSSEQVDQERGALDRFLDAHPEIQGEVVGEPSRIADVNYIHEHP